MHVFVTGASGLIGSAITRQLIAAGHTVSGLARSEASAAIITEMGAEAVRGTHTDLSTLAAEAAKAEAVAHCAFNHDIAFTGGMEQAITEDVAAIKAMCEVLVGTNKVFLNSAGLLGTTVDEATVKDEGGFGRSKSEHTTSSYGAKGVRSVNVRLPPVVHGPGREHPFVSNQIAVAKKTGFAGYVGDGSVVWSAADVEDVAKLYILCILKDSKVPAGAAVHAAAEPVILTKDIAEFIAKKLGGLEVKAIAPGPTAMAQFGPLGMIMALSGSVSIKLTQEWTGWDPVGKTLFEEMEGYSF